MFEHGTIKIKGKDIMPNPYFLDIYKKDLGKKIEQPGMFEQYESYLEHIKRMFSDLPEDNQFWLQNGESLENLFFLYKAFERMDKKTYRNHISNGKNDFAEWVKRAYNDVLLYEDLLKCETPEDAKEIVEKRIYTLQGGTGAIPKAKHKNIFSYFLHQMKEENEEIEKKLEDKKKEILNSRIDLEVREKQNIENHKRLLMVYEELKQQERLLMEKIELLKREQSGAGRSIMGEERAIQKGQHMHHEHDRSKPDAGLGDIQDLMHDLSGNKDAEELLNTIREQREWINRKFSELSIKKEDVEEIDSKVESLEEGQPDVKAQENIKSIDEGIKELSKTRITKLLDSAVACLKKEDFHGAKESLDKIKKYYDNLGHESEEKKEFDKRIAFLREMALESAGEKDEKGDSLKQS